MLFIRISFGNFFYEREYCDSNPMCRTKKIIIWFEILLQIVANDTTNPNCCSRAFVTINILDMNDNSPKFTDERYVLTVKEHASIGTIIGTVTVGSVTLLINLN